MTDRVEIRDSYHNPHDEQHVKYLYVMNVRVAGKRYRRLTVKWYLGQGRRMLQKLPVDEAIGRLLRVLSPTPSTWLGHQYDTFARLRGLA